MWHQRSRRPATTLAHRAFELWRRQNRRAARHVFCCMPALKLTRQLEQRLQAVFGTTDTDRPTVTLPDALAALSRRRLQNYEIDEKTMVTRLSRPDADQKQILAALGASLPEK